MEKTISSEHILIVDDDTVVAGAVQIILEDAGYSTTVTNSFAEARTALDQCAFSGAIFDVWLKGEDGLDLAAALSEKAPDIPFLVMSGGGPGRSLEHMTARADALGASSVLFKPFQNEELTAAVAAMFNGTHP